jgi:hypothetical protein
MNGLRESPVERAFPASLDERLSGMPELEVPGQDEPASQVQLKDRFHFGPITHLLPNYKSLSGDLHQAALITTIIKNVQIYRRGLVYIILQEKPGDDKFCSINQTPASYRHFSSPMALWDQQFMT